MSIRHYHNAPAPVSTRRRCAVCNQAVYSTAGIHPQCAVRQSEPPRSRPKEIAAVPAAEPATTPGS
jgi:hypothetical protein